MRVYLGEILRNKFTGELYEVQKFQFDKVLLVARGLPDKGWYGDVATLGFQYDKVGYGENDFSK